MKIILSVDPGVNGGIAVHDSAATIPNYAIGMPDTEGDILDVIRDINATGERVAYVEEVGGYIGRPQPGSAMFKFGRNFGFILGVLQCSGFRIVLVKPQKWQKHFGFGKIGRQKAVIKEGATKEEIKAEKKRIASINSRLDTEWKNKLKSKAQQLFPSIKVTLGTSDALLILAYAQHCENFPASQELPSKGAKATQLMTADGGDTFVIDGKICWFTTTPCETCFKPLTTNGNEIWCSRGQCENESVQK